jgi:hypothetical protein
VGHCYHYSTRLDKGVSAVDGVKGATGDSTKGMYVWPWWRRRWGRTTIGKLLCGTRGIQSGNTMQLCGTRQRQVMHSPQADDLCMLGMVDVLSISK